MLTTPLFYYPTTIVWVDDDALFLNAIAQILSTGNYIRTFRCVKNFLLDFGQKLLYVSKQHFLNFFPLPQKHGEFRPSLM